MAFRRAIALETAIKWDELSYAQQQIAKHTIFSFADYSPQDTQKPIHETVRTLIFVSGGEGSGKSQSTGAEVAARYPTWRRVLFVAYKAESAQNEADYLVSLLESFKAVKQYSKPKGGNVEITTRDGAIVESVSTHQKGAQAVTGTGKSYDIVCMLEAGKQSYPVFLACLIRASRTGATLIISGTIEKSEPWFPDMIRKMQEDEKRRNEMNAEVVILPTWGNLKLYPGGRNDPKILLLEKELTPELFAERLAGQPSPPEGLVLRGFSFLTHVFEWVKFDDNYPVYLAIDPGYSGSHYSVNFIQLHTRAYTRQFRPELPDASITDVWVIGDLYLNYTTHEEIIEIAKQLPWWSRVREGVGDIVMKTHPMADRAPIDVWAEKTGILLRGQLVGIQDGIDRHRTFLKDPATKSPRIFFNPECKGIREYGLWKKKLIGDDLWGKPEDSNCDYAKAIQYFLIDQFGRIEKRIKNDNSVVGERITMQQEYSTLPDVLDGTRIVKAQSIVPRKGSSYVVVQRNKPKLPV